MEKNVGVIDTDHFCLDGYKPFPIPVLRFRNLWKPEYTYIEKMRKKKTYRKISGTKNDSHKPIRITFC